jgi:cell division protein FtsL
MRLFRISNILSFAVATVCGVLLFWTSQAVQQKENQLSQIRKNLTQETETIRVLSVEWDYLNRPQRLEQLARDQLHMEPPSVKEVVRNVSEIPEPMFEEEGIVQAVSMQAPKAAPAPKSEIVAPSKAEKQNFEALIQNLSGEQ